MDEFDKIKEVSEDIAHRKEPTFTHDLTSDNAIFTTSDTDETSDDAGLYLSHEDMDKIPMLDIQDLEEKSISSMKLHMIALSIFIGILIVVLSGFFFFGEDKDDSNEIITITATPTPVKVKPEQPGGMQIPDQDKLVYNRIRANEVPTKIERLFPEPEKPVLPEILTPEPTPAQEPQPINPTAEKIAEKPIVPPQQVVEIVPPTPKKEVLPLPTKVTPKPADNKAPKTTTAAVKDTWRVQLLSSSNKQSVEKAWPTILKKNKALLSDMSHDIVPAQIAGKGTFYRLQVGSFPSRDMAAGLCSKLKARKQECVPVKP